MVVPSPQSEERQLASDKTKEDVMSGE